MEDICSVPYMKARTQQLIGFLETFLCNHNFEHWFHLGIAKGWQCIVTRNREKWLKQEQMISRYRHMRLGVIFFRSYRHACESLSWLHLSQLTYTITVRIIALIAGYHQHYVPASGHTKVRFKVKNGRREHSAVSAWVVIRRVNPLNLSFSKSWTR